MRETNIRKSSPAVKSRTGKAQPKPAPEPVKPALRPRAPVALAPSPAKPVPAAPKQRAAARPVAPPPARAAQAKSAPPAFDPTAFGSHDEAARAALQKTRAAWICDADAERSRARYFDVVRRLRRPSLLVSASLVTLLREKLRLSALGLPVLLLQPSEGRLPRGDVEALLGPGPLLVLVSSEALFHDEVLSALERASLATVAVDGAELASERGHEHRPSFARLPELLQRFGKASLFALARPVPSAVRREAQQRLGLADACVVEAPLVEPHVLLDARAVRGERRNTTLLEVLAELPRPGVILCATPHEVDAVYAVIGSERGVVCRVHAGMPVAERAHMLARFNAESAPALLVTTSALGPDAGLPGLGEGATSEARTGFGLGGVRSDLAFVLHHHAPASLEQYARELGGLGAGGAEAIALLFYDSSHRSMNQAILEQQRLPAAKVEPFARALEAALGLGKPLKLEALALQTGLSRRTCERLIALFVDAGLVRRSAAGLSLLKAGDALQSASAGLATALEALTRADSSRLGAVERYAEANECKRRILAQRFGTTLEAACGRCVSCRARGTAQRQAVVR